MLGLLGISYTEHITNEEVRVTNTKHAKLYEDLLTTVELKKKKNSLVWTYTKHITNEEVRATITKHVKHIYNEELLTTVKKRKLRWYEHVTRASGLLKTILYGTVQGRRRRGRQRKSWMDTIAEWTGESFATTQAPAHDRQRWRQLVQRSTVQRPQDPGRG